jgi:hypothetical protein
MSNRAHDHMSNRSLALARRPSTPQLGNLADHRQIERACELLYAGWDA